MIYNNYKKTRNASWKCLIECNITKLPTDLSQICRHYGIQIVKNSNLTASKLCPDERGKAIKLDEKYYIIVRDSDSVQAQRYTIAHEIGHILINSASEYEAERFAIGILAPACVLWGLNLKTPGEIAKACNISIKSASIRAQRMQVLYERNKFLIDPLERKLYQQFESFINA